MCQLSLKFQHLLACADAASPGKCRLSAAFNLGSSSSSILDWFCGLADLVPDGNGGGCFMVKRGWSKSKLKIGTYRT